MKPEKLRWIPFTGFFAIILSVMFALIWQIDHANEHYPWYWWVIWWYGMIAYYGSAIIYHMFLKKKENSDDI